MSLAVLMTLNENHIQDFTHAATLDMKFSSV